MELTFIQFIGEFAIASFTGVFITALKHVFARTFVLKYFLDDSLYPFLWSFAGGVLITVIVYFFPQFTFFIESEVGQEVSLNHDRLLLTGTILSASIKAMFKRQETINKYR